jgi:pentatricopeptide repeat protein
VTGFTEKASNLVKYGVQVGDRILAVESSIGGRLWPVSTVEGVISAVTARLPGQQVTFRFERRSSVNSLDIESKRWNEDASVNVTESDDFRVAQAVSAARTADIASTVAMQKIPDFELLKKCRAVLKRYTTDEKYINKFELPAIVADKVMQTIASAEAQMDPVTLSMVQTAYISSNRPQKAIDAFEAAVGLKGDGSSSVVVPSEASIAGTDDKRIIPTFAALDLFTASSLMKALQMKGDIASVQRVLQALEGKAGNVIDGLEVGKWPGTGLDGLLQPDIQCYNIVMSALAEQPTGDSLQQARDIFKYLTNPGRKGAPVDVASDKAAPRKDVVSYNTMIKFLADFGAHEEAINVFYQMKAFGIQPDKLSYTCLAKAVMVNDDLEELLYDMKERGVTPDVIFFNAVIKDLCNQKKLPAARKIVTLMESSGVSPNSLTYGYLMKGLMDAGKPSAALTLFESACADSKTAGLTENVHLYTSAITAAASIGDYTRALEFISRMKAAGVKPNLTTMTALLGACLSAEKPELAVGIFKSIPDPDFYALGQGLLAMSKAGEGDKVLQLLSENGSMASRLRGKRLMVVYESLFAFAIEREDFDMARRTMSNLMQKGNIPSKAIYQKIFESMKLTSFSGLVSKVSFSQDGVVRRNGPDEVDMQKYKFLMFFVDALSARNLPCEAALYSTILSFGNHLGGLPRKISALMIAAKVHAGDFGSNRLIDDDKCENECVVSGWEDLVLSYDDIRNQLMDPSSLPRLHVRVSKKDVPRVLKAEKNLSYAAILSPRRRKEV